jgi:t-SNARE complex subunit (syntaxin)
MVHKPKIKDEETNNGPQTKDYRRRDKQWSTNQRLKAKRQTMVHKPKIKDEEKNYGPQTKD